MSNHPLQCVRFVFLMIAAFAGHRCSAADWPMWRFDAARSAVSPGSLPSTLNLQWSRDLGIPRPAWPTEQDYQGKLEYDRSFEPIVLGHRLIVPSMVKDSVTAYDTVTGAEVWRFYADGPVRFAPVGEKGRVYFVSDDGHLYCVDADAGKLIWKVRGGPTDRAILGNERLISTWPARGAPVIYGEQIYFAAGIWPFMGTFLHAVDTTTGKVIWTNSGTGAIYNLHQHGGADAFGGVAPQGYFAANENKLLVAGGLAVPALFDRATGQFLHFEQSHDVAGKGSGGFDVAVNGIWYFNRGRMFDIENGKPLLDLATPLIAEQQVTGLHEGHLIRFAPELRSEEIVVTDRKGKKTRETRHSLKEVARVKPPIALEKLFLQAGGRYYGTTADGELAALEWLEGADSAQVIWSTRIEQKPFSVVAADDRLFVVTVEGKLLCYGGESRQPTHHPLPGLDASQDRWSETAAQLLKENGKTSGFALVWGLESGRLVEELVRQSNLYVIAIDPDTEKVDALRRRLDAAQYYGRRAHVICADPATYRFPPYFADLLVSERSDSDQLLLGLSGNESIALLKKAFHTLRPYGGNACLAVDANHRAELRQRIDAAGLEHGEVSERGDWLTLTRVGALPGAGQWTHQYNNSGNTLFSQEKRVKLPLGVLWFGGPSNREALPRHGQGPVPQVAGGRLIIEGVDSLSARCVYTGRVFWKREFADIGFPYKANNHTFTELVYINNQPGANYIGSNYVSLADGIYVLYKNECQRLNPETGETMSTFKLPISPGEEQPDAWGYMTIWGDYLVAAARPQIFDDKRIGEQNWNSTSSQRIVVMNRHSGDVLWSRDAVSGFRHNAIVPINDKLFLIDRLSEGVVKLMARRGIKVPESAHLMALDLKSGGVIWETKENVFGTWLSYSTQHDILLQAGRTGGRESLVDEPSKRMIALNGSNGTVLWDKEIEYTGPLVLHGDQIISSGRGQGSIHLLTGEQKLRKHPLTEEIVPWSHSRTYGCGVMLGCQNLLTFRSGAAGYFDMANDSGTGNFGGFKAGCTPNLIPADGVLSAPDYTRTCSCSYQNQTSLALIHEADISPLDIELWTHSTLPAPGPGKPVKRVGINFGAPGDRVSESGTLWLEFPSVGGTSPDIPVRVSGGKVERWFRDHAALIADVADNASLPWVAGSGLEGAVSLRITLELGPSPPVKPYTVRLHFAEPDSISESERVFDVFVQREKLLESVDLVKEAGAAKQPIVRELKGIQVADELHLELRATAGSKKPPVLSGLEIVQE